jgi:hypothetical protein
MTRPRTRPRGRPPKFGRPSQVVALTLPEDVVERLRRVDRDLGWAIVKLLDDAHGAAPRADAEEPQPDVELVSVADRRALIVVNRAVIRNLPDVNMIPLGGNRAFLALESGRGMSDLELAVIDSLAGSSVSREERRALRRFRAQLAAWRRDHQFRFHTRAIIVAERVGRRRG